MLHRAGHVPHRKLSEVTQAKQLATVLNRDRANGRVNCSTQLEDVAGGRNALKGYNRPAWQPPTVPREFDCGRGLPGFNSPQSRVTAAARTTTEVVFNDST